jgi:hypothetical protein
MTRVLIIAALAVASAALTAFTPGADHNLMNASSGPIILDIRSSRDKVITHFRLAPGYTVSFNGVFSGLRIRMSDGKTLSFSERQLTRLHSDSTPANGAWLVQDSGVRSVSHTDYMLAYRRFHKLWP